MAETRHITATIAFAEIPDGPTCPTWSCIELHFADPTTGAPRVVAERCAGGHVRGESHRSKSGSTWPASPEELGPELPVVVTVAYEPRN